MALIPMDDMVHLEEIAPTETMKLHLLTDQPDTKKRAKVLAVGPGPISSTGGRTALDVQSGDVVIVHSGAGFRFAHEGKQQWFVYGARSDIIAKVTD